MICGEKLDNCNQTRQVDCKNSKKKFSHHKMSRGEAGGTDCLSINFINDENKYLLDKLKVSLTICLKTTYQKLSSNQFTVYTIDSKLIERFCFWTFMRSFM